MRGLTLLLLIGVATPPVTAESPQDFAQAIYKRLARVTGDGRRPPPLEVIPDERRSQQKQAAWFDTNAGTIGMDEKTIRLCQSMSGRASACVAFFLGHELAHFYKDHAWGADFGSRLAATPLGPKIQELSIQQRLGFEAQADDFGGIYGYLAGYDTFGVAREALGRVYQAYAIPDTSSDYPSLPERESIARNSADRLKALIPVFEAANLLFAIGRYAEASACFGHIARIFPSREILSNAAVALAIGSGAPDADRYPWLLDTQTRLRMPSQRRGIAPVTEAERREMIESAIRDLEDAARRDPDYFPAFLNLSLVNDLAGRHGSALDYGSRALEMSNTYRSVPATAAARLARAIASIHLHDKSSAELDLAAAESDPSSAY